MGMLRKRADDEAAIAGNEPRMDVLASLQSDINRVFDELWHRPFFGGLPARSLAMMERNIGFNPKIDIADKGGWLQVTAELPGLEEKDIELKVNDHYLRLSGEKRTESEEKEEGYYRMERAYGRFERVVELPCEVNNDEVSAKFHNGVLTVSIPKSARAVESERKIPIVSA